MTDDPPFVLDVSESRDYYQFTVSDTDSGETLVKLKVSKDADVDDVERILNDFGGATEDVIDAVGEHL